MSVRRAPRECRASIFRPFSPNIPLLSPKMHRYLGESILDRIIDTHSLSSKGPRLQTRSFLKPRNE